MKNGVGETLSEVSCFFWSMFFDNLDEDEWILSVDNGSCWIRGGVAGEETPVCDTRTMTGSRRVNDGDTMTDERFVGYHPAINSGDVTSLEYPIERGVIQNWDVMEHIWDYMFYERMKIDPTSWALVMSVPVLSPKAQIERKAQIFFEKYNFQSFFVSDEGTMSTLSHGLSTALCLTIGEGTTSVAVTYDGIRVPSATQKYEMGGKDVTSYLQSLMCDRGYNFTTSVELELLREIKEKCCVVLEKPFSKEKTDTRVSHQDTSLVELLDDDIIQMTSEKWACPEMLFQPSLAGLTYPGIHQMIKNSINNLPLDMRKEVASRIVVTGGTARMTGLHSRLASELKKDKFLPSGLEPKLLNHNEDDLAGTSGWIGISIAGCINESKDLFVRKADYDEYGPGLVQQTLAQYIYSDQKEGSSLP